MRAWYVAKTKPRVERQAAAVLEQRGLESYFPLIAQQTRRSLPEKLEPLFPGYLFARLDVETPDWLMARSAPGIAYFLGSGHLELPTTVPDGLVDEIRARVTRHDYRRREPSFHHGDRVVINSGPFEGLDAVFDATLSPAGRSRVLVAIVSRLVPVCLDVTELRAVGAASSAVTIVAGGREGSTTAHWKGWPRH
jgi:transcriptional antiterminator RfaH